MCSRQESSALKACNVDRQCATVGSIGTCMCLAGIPASFSLFPFPFSIVLCSGSPSILQLQVQFLFLFLFLHLLPLFSCPVDLYSLYTNLSGTYLSVLVFNALVATTLTPFSLRLPSTILCALRIASLRDTSAAEVPPTTPQPAPQLDSLSNPFHKAPTQIISVAL